jgi:hypothetical protein
MASKFRVTLKSAFPTSAIVEAPDETVAIGEMYATLLDWLDEAEFEAEPIEDEKVN